MLIRVVYNDYKFDFIKSFRLDEFIEAGKISMFRRESGWVFVGIDPIRQKKINSFCQKIDRRQRTNSLG